MCNENKSQTKYKNQKKISYKITKLPTIEKQLFCNYNIFFIKYSND